MCLFAGCEKAEEPVSPPANAPQSYMRDKAFMGRLEAERQERVSLASVRERLVGEMRRKLDAARAAKPGADEAALKAELERDPEFVSLRKRVVDLGKAIDENRQRATKLVGERLRPQTDISK